MVHDEFHVSWLRSSSSARRKRAVCPPKPITSLLAPAATDLVSGEGNKA